MPVRAKVTLRPLTTDGVRVEVRREECGRISFLPFLFTPYQVFLALVLLL